MTRPKMAAAPSRDDCPYAALAIAVVKRAVDDAQGATSPAHFTPPAVLIREARAWLADERNVADWLELANQDAEPVLRRIRHLLQQVPPKPEGPQLSLWRGVA